MLDGNHADVRLVFQWWGLLTLIPLSLSGIARAQSAAAHDPASRTAPSPPSPATENPEAAAAMPIRISVHGVRFEEAWGDLAGQLGIVALLDASVTAGDLDERVRMDAYHLTGPQALRWLGRLAGLVVIERQGIWLVTRPDAVPRAWQMRQPPPRAAAAATTSPGIPGKRADIVWLDSPLSRVARDVAEGYGLDVLFSADLQASQPMLTATLTAAGLDAVIEELARQLSARVLVWDGVLWVQPADRQLPAGAGRIMPVERRETGSADPVMPSVEPTPAGTAMIQIDERQDSWQAFGERLAGAEIPIRLEIAPGHPYPEVAAHGTAAEILAAAALLGRLEFETQVAGTERGGVLVIRAGPR